MRLMPFRALCALATFAMGCGAVCASFSSDLSLLTPSARPLPQAAFTSAAASALRTFGPQPAARFSELSASTFSAHQSDQSDLPSSSPDRGDKPNDGTVSSTPTEEEPTRPIPANVCSIPSAPQSHSRESVLADLARNTADAMDPSVAPCENFYYHACGGWLKKTNLTTMPPDKSSWSKSFSVIDERNERILREILECSQQRLNLMQPMQPEQPKQPEQPTSEQEGGAKEEGGQEQEQQQPSPSESSSGVGSARRGGASVGAIARLRLRAQSSSFKQADDDEEEEEEEKEEKEKEKKAKKEEDKISLPPARIEIPPGPADVEELQLARFYQGCMNQARKNERGLEPLQPILRRINDIQARDEIMQVAGDLFHDDLLGFFWGTGVGVNPSNPTRYQVDIMQGGIPFASRELLVGPTNRTREYAVHVTRMLELTGVDPAAAVERATRIVDFQTSIARIMLPPEALRYPERLHNPMPISALSADTSLDFLSFLAGALGNESLSSDLIINVGMPEHMRQLGELLQATPLHTLKEVMNWQALLSFSGDLPEKFGREYFRFFGTELAGTPKRPALWKRCQGQVLSYMSDAISKRYLEVAFSKETETQAREMMQLVQLAFLRRLPTLTWMTPADKLAAAQKLGAMIMLVGGNRPDQRLNFSAVTLDPEDHFGNVRRLREFNWNDTVHRLKKPVDRTLFQMSAPTVNAYYDPTLNSMNFPAGIIQPPFFSAVFPAAWNFGALGSVMGHELTHGFDDEGRKFNASGALSPWWHPATTAAFANATQCLITQYSNYSLTRAADSPQEFIRGFLTLGENIADQGGVTLSWLALRLKLGKEQQRTAQPEASLAPPLGNHDRASREALAFAAGEDGSEAVEPAFLQMKQAEPRLENLTEQQLFFLSYAQAWCRVVRPEAFLRALEHDPHSPSEARVNVPLLNFPPFHAAFHCPAEAMPRTATECVVW